MFVSSEPTAIALDKGATRVVLKSVSPRTSAARPLPPQRQVYLRLSRLQAKGQPGVSYNVYLNLPAGEAPRGVNDPHYVGTFNYFNATTGRPQDIAFNVTDWMQRYARETNDPTLTVTLAPAGIPQTDSAPEIGQIQLVAE
ncbi:MAG: hypothetical protein JWN71_2054 [Xanthobacteraceae bacterium]|nr:hypothetical protein [Xanthobacteraceae bacterium]